MGGRGSPLGRGRAGRQLGVPAAHQGGDVVVQPAGSRACLAPHSPSRGGIVRTFPFSKHTAELGVDEDQLDTVKLAPGKNVTGTITSKGTFKAKYVTYTDGLIGDSVRGDVS